MQPLSMSPLVQKARARLLLQSAFFGTVLLSTPMYPCRSVPTAATNMKEIRYNPDFFDKLPIDEVIGVMAHELLHIVLLHGLRRGSRSPVLWNIAADYAVNLMLVACGFKLPSGGLYDKAYKGMSAEQIYDKLLKDNPTGGGKPGDGKPGDGIPGLGADLLDPDAASPGDAREIEAQIKQVVAQAAQMQRMRGDIPAGLNRLIQDVLHPPVPWPELLRPYMQAMCRDDETWTRRNRRFQDIYLPSRYSHKIGRVVLIGDTSGSITNEELRKVGGTVIDIVEDVRPEAIHVLWADTEVAHEQTFEAGDRIDLLPKGGGGTDMRVPLIRAAELDPAVVVLVTDGRTPWPREPTPFPLIVLCTTRVDVPVGEVIRV